MKVFFVAMMLMTLAACAAVGLPKANNAETAAWEGAATYGILTHTANQYLYAPECTSPITVLPCSKASVRATLRTNLDNAYNAMLKAVAAIRNAPDATSTTQAKADADAAIKKADKQYQSVEVQSTMHKERN